MNYSSQLTLWDCARIIGHNILACAIAIPLSALLGYYVIRLGKDPYPVCYLQLGLGALAILFLIFTMWLNFKKSWQATYGLSVRKVWSGTLYHFLGASACMLVVKLMTDMI